MGNNNTSEAIEFAKAMGRTFAESNLEIMLTPEGLPRDQPWGSVLKV